VKIYRGRLILYGCGKCIDDYEGTSGHEEFRDDLRLLYFPSVATGSRIRAAGAARTRSMRSARLRRS